MQLTKNVNGVDVPLTPEEVQEIQTFWDRPKPVVIPQVVTPAQGGLALIQLGHMSNVLGVIETLRQDPVANAEPLWAWDKATEWHRVSPTLNMLADAAGITQTQMDEAFTLGKTLQP